MHREPAYPQQSLTIQDTGCPTYIRAIISIDCIMRNPLTHYSRKPTQASQTFLLPMSSREPVFTGVGDWGSDDDQSGGTGNSYTQSGATESSQTSTEHGSGGGRGANAHSHQNRDADEEEFTGRPNEQRRPPKRKPTNLRSKKRRRRPAAIQTSLTLRSWAS